MEEDMRCASNGGKERDLNLYVYRSQEAMSKTEKS